MKIAHKNLGSRIVVSGDVIEFYEYDKPISVDFERKTEIIKKNTDDSSKREDNLYRARKNVREIVWANLTPHTKLLTLTYKITQLDVKLFNRHFQTFLQAMKRDGYKLDYLYILERQKERGIKEGNVGSLHPHVVIFNDEYIPLEVIAKNWKHGSFDIHMLDGLRCDNGHKSDELIRNAGAYICKYITKDSCLEWQSHVYRCSKGLKRPEEVKFYAYGGINEKGFPDYVIENDRFYQFLKSQSDIGFHCIRDFSFQSKDGTIYNNTVAYYQGRFSTKMTFVPEGVVEEIE